MATETLRPNKAGNLTGIPTQYPVSGSHHDKVDEESSDGDSTYIESVYEWEGDLYNLPASAGAGTINFIKVYIVCRGTDGSLCNIGAYKIVVKASGTTSKGSEYGQSVTTSYVSYDHTWATNPADGQPWEWADIDALQIGIDLRRSDEDHGARCTQVYVEVDYTPAGWTGKISGVTNPAKIMGVDVANIAKVKGVA